MSAACPRCRVSLVAATCGDLHLRGCAQCGGLWLDYRATGRVLSSMHAETLATADAAAARATHAVDTSHAGLACPDCRAALRRMVIPGSTVEVDRCDDHGTWFDRAELRHAAEAVARTRSGAAPGPGGAVAAGAVGVGMAGAAGAVALSMNDDQRNRMMDAAGEVAEGGIDVAEAGFELADTVDGAEIAGGVLEIAVGILGSILD